MTGFTPCPTCAGMGFLSKGEFARRIFVTCRACNGSGSVLQPVTPPPQEPKAANPPEDDYWVSF